MGHVIAHHAAIREEQARQVAIINHVVNDVLSDPQIGALALAKSKLTLAAFSRAQEFEADGIGVGISARAGFRPLRRVALPRPTCSAMPISRRPPAEPTLARWTFCPAIPRRPTA